jgi:ring-1,2-phenylacetyl-CoA epoxidase subunit PaaE
MLNDIKESLKDYGLNSENIHFELFNAPDEIDNLANEDSIQKKINLIIDGDSFEFSMNSNDSNILKSGIDAGIDLPYACLNGVCCSCRAKILKGEAKMKKNFALDADEVDAGYVLCCQTYPLSDLQISFDE